MPSQDAIVVGGGVIGLAVALRLAEDLSRIILVQPGIVAPDGASQAAGAMLGALGEISAPPGMTDADAGMDELAFRLRAADRYPTWLDELAETAGRRPRHGFGTFVFATGASSTDRRAVAYIAEVAEQYRRHWEWVDPDDVPNLAPNPQYEASHALFLPDEGWVDGPELLDTLRAALIRAPNVVLVDGRVRAIARSDSRVDGVILDGGDTLTADSVVVCAGVGTSALLAGASECCPERGRAHRTRSSFTKPSICLRYSYGTAR
jgi:glycine oxidase